MFLSFLKDVHLTEDREKLGHHVVDYLRFMQDCLELNQETRKKLEPIRLTTLLQEVHDAEVLRDQLLKQAMNNKAIVLTDIQVIPARTYHCEEDDVCHSKENERRHYNILDMVFKKAKSLKEKADAKRKQKEDELKLVSSFVEHTMGFEEFKEAFTSAPDNKLKLVELLNYGLRFYIQSGYLDVSNPIEKEVLMKYHAMLTRFPTMVSFIIYLTHRHGTLEKFFGVADSILYHLVQRIRGVLLSLGKVITNNKIDSKSPSALYERLLFSNHDGSLNLCDNILLSEAFYTGMDAKQYSKFLVATIAVSAMQISLDDFLRNPEHAHVPRYHYDPNLEMLELIKGNKDYDFLYNPTTDND